MIYTHTAVLEIKTKQIGCGSHTRQITRAAVYQNREGATEVTAVQLGESGQANVENNK